MNAPCRRLWFGLLLAGCLLLMIGETLSAQPRALEKPLGPDVVILSELENEYLPVPFNHAAHAQMAEMWQGCVTCHHRSPEPDAAAAPFNLGHSQEEASHIPACKSCHPIQAEDISIQMPNLKGAYHRQCLNCHKDWSGENQCGMCHEPKNGDTSLTVPTPGDIVGRMHPPIEPPSVKVYQARYKPAAGVNITFRHDEHVQRYGLQCVNCHYRDTCGDCHSQGAAPRHKPVEPAISWQQSHTPCMVCHQNQSCTHCHHHEDAEPPPVFNHEWTGQLLDEDHAGLTCGQCHRGLDFTAEPSCGDSKCHGETIVAFPQDRPGEFIDIPLLEGTPTPMWASLRPRPVRLSSAMPEQRLTPLTPIERPARAIPPMQLPPTPAGGNPSCVTDECHVAVKAYTHIHGPVNVDACEVCHKLEDEETHRFSLMRESQSLCTYCHEFDARSMLVLHEPVKREECLGCHNPHGGSTRYLTREESIAQMCGRCHEPITTSMSFLHSPVRDGDCTACHAPHGARLANLMDLAGTDLCIACHADFGNQLAQAPVTHEAMKEQCQRCHGVHGSNQPLSLVKASPEMCYDCHDTTRQEVAYSMVAHTTATVEGRACLHCHTPHGGSLDHLMRDLPRTLCLACHDEPLESGDGRIIAAVADINNTAMHQHGPLTDGRCTGCHQPHGSDHLALLTAGYERRLYRGFSGDQEAFCFQCHDPLLAVQQDELAEPVTAFRNGLANLHTLHIEGRSGRTCSACHATHAAENPKMIRTSLRFRQWESPINFRKTDAGGYCAPGCHIALSYDRDEPVIFDTQYTRAQPTLTSARLDPRPPVSLAATDLHGEMIRVPAADRVSILAALRTDDDRSGKTIAPLIAALRDQPRALVVMLVTGGDADEYARWLSTLAGNVGHIIADETGDIGRRLDIRAWPTVLLIHTDGEQLARLTGAPVSLALRLPGYLAPPDDRARPGASPGHSPIITDQPTRTIIWYVTLAEQLRQKDLASKAEAVLIEARKLHPGNPALQRALAETLLDLDRPQDALNLLSSADDAPASLLRARAAMRLNRYDDAQSILTTLLANHPTEREAHFLLGELHEHAGRWREAAESYRRAHER